MHFSPYIQVSTQMNSRRAEISFVLCTAPYPILRTGPETNNFWMKEWLPPSGIFYFLPI